MHRFVSHSPYCPVVRLNGPRAYIGHHCILMLCYLLIKLSKLHLLSFVNTCFTLQIQSALLTVDLLDMNIRFLSK